MAQNSDPVRKRRGSGRPFTGADDPRRNSGGVPPDVREVKAALALEGMELVRALMKLVRKGNVVAIKTGLEYVLGKPKQEVEISGKDGGAIRIVDPSRLTDEQLNGLESILAAGAAGEDEPADPPPSPSGEGT